jgi:hypothetical protein
MRIDPSDIARKRYAKGKGEADRRYKWENT